MNCRTQSLRHIRSSIRLSALFVVFVATVAGCSPRDVHQTAEVASTVPSESSRAASVQPVMGTMTSLPDRLEAGDAFELRVSVKIDSAHHIYASNTVRSPFVPATLEVALPDGVEALGTWNGPEPKRRRGGEWIYTDTVEFRRSFRLQTNVPPGLMSIRGEFRFQACTDELCWPPRTIPLATSIRVSLP